MPHFFALFDKVGTEGRDRQLAQVISVSYGIALYSGSTTTVTSNLITGTLFGIDSLPGAAGSISDNTLINNTYGVLAAADGVPVTSNKIFNSISRGIDVTASPAIQGNTIINSPIAIGLNCLTSGNVHSNIITDAGTALDRVPSGLVLSNSYFNVGTIRTGC